MIQVFSFSLYYLACEGTSQVTHPTPAPAVTRAVMSCPVTTQAQPTRSHGGVSGAGPSRIRRRGTASQPSSLSPWADTYFKEATEYQRQIMPFKIATAKLKQQYWEKMVNVDVPAPPPAPAPVPVQTIDPSSSSDSEDNVLTHFE